jgi:hypothetical protein
LLTAELTEAGAAQDDDLVAAAKAIMELVDQLGREVRQVQRDDQGLQRSPVRRRQLPGKQVLAVTDERAALGRSVEIADRRWHSPCRIFALFREQAPLLHRVQIIPIGAICAPGERCDQPQNPPATEFGQLPETLAPTNHNPKMGTFRAYELASDALIVRGDHCAAGEQTAMRARRRARITSPRAPCSRLPRHRACAKP